MKLISINVGFPRAIRHQGHTITTGIFKEPVAGPAFLRTLNLEGDGQADLRVHGGKDKAVYAYPIEHYEVWARELRRTDFVPGQFGENFTVEGMLEDAVNLGDVFRIGDAVLEVTQPRLPCLKLAMRMGLPQFPKAFLASRRSGFYLRVLAEGMVAAGDEIARVRAAPEQVSVREALDLKFFDKENCAGLHRILRVKALSNQWREDFEEQLQQLNLVLETNSPV